MTQTTVNAANASLAQTFTVSAPDGVSGIYVPGVQLYFQAKSQSFGVQLSIVQLTNGLPDTSIPIVGASCTLNASQVSVSDDGSVATTFAFPQLVFLQSDTPYALIVRGLGSTPDYQIWYAEAGDKDKVTGATISSTMLVGNMYYAKSSTNWSEAAGASLKFVINRCQFNIGNTAYAGLIKSNTDIFTLTNSSFTAGPIDIQAGDEVWGLYTDGANNTTANTSQHAKVVKYDVSNQMLYCRDSTGNFSVNTAIQIVRTQNENSLANASMLAMSTVGAVYDAPIDGAIIKVGSPSDSMSGIGFSYLGSVKASNGAFILDSDYVAMPQQTENEFIDRPRYALGRSDENLYLGGNSSIHIKAMMTSNSDFISPIIDMNERYLLGYENLINSSIANEYSNQGEAYTRYISNPVTLAEGMDAETLSVWVDAYKPYGTEVYVFAKIWNGEDPNSFDANPWSLMQQVSNVGVNSDPNDTSDYVEYEYQFQNALMETDDPNYTASMAYQPLNAGVAQTVQYQSVSNTGTYYGFKTFAIKIVESIDGEDSNIYPRVTDVRAIAMML